MVLEFLGFWEAESQSIELLHGRLSNVLLSR